MTRPDNTLRAKSSRGWETSVMGKNIIDDMFPQDYTKPSFRTFSLMVKEDCELEIQLGNYEPEILYITKEKGLELSSNFSQLYGLSFVESDISFYFLCSY